MNGSCRFFSRTALPAVRGPLTWGGVVSPLSILAEGVDWACGPVGVRKSPGQFRHCMSEGLLDRLTDSHVFSAGSGSTYFIVVRAIDEAGNESVDSTEVQVTLP